METGSVKVSNLSRQVKDIIAQAECLKNSGSFENDAENFSKYNEELKVFLIQYVNEPMIRERVDRLPTLNYKKIKTPLWYWVLLPAELVVLLKNYYAKQQFLNAVDEARSTYSSILFLMGKQ